MHQLGVKSISWTGGGDPSLHPDICELVAYAYQDFRQGMFTNALAMPQYNPVLMSWIRVTMTDKPYREDVLLKLRGARTLGFAFNYSGPHDDDYLRETLDVAERVRANYVQVRPALKFHGETVDIKPPEMVHPLLVITDYKFREARLPHGTHYQRCEAYHFSPMIWEDGNVDVCAYMRKHEGYTLGNINTESLKTILDRAPQTVPVHDKCQVCCRLHEMNKAITHARELEDVTFP
jgi:MoaA/NifB/PqqE/SkfB family radical SAM enzyme